ncbi:MFS transporter [bacterium M00.F.Ca.ET.228.01.1.1]|uniref:MFS transporter n=1 Tax=Paraburkholderia phenoliruptrix TaxID=252970 RepID=UPI001091E767|nr:MFS transporter [Paraburkholderia phenoliruptrix]TGP40510.1 MFS transporter [bacterium M00.F.Ca.ET.228.01.1.1]TGR96745.1 MFS transporter [bacterium M00.F.Ca.ET.191.01.1.1]TGT98012.1 MFS transporter [bacterium M00.F.Ca.ET.155.01.1.1]MBW0446043.1 MFS transporter [Paraburkholderia phenoliruptrix]MBW9100045.1 MFS transporter [Paraburkholderia phenoliruptrix]
MNNQDIQANPLDVTPAFPAAASPARRPVSIDDVPLNAFHVKIAGLTFGAHFTEGFALGTIGYALAAMNRQMPLDAFWMGMIGSSALMGIFFGSLVFGWLSDRLGRQKIFLISFLVITVAAFAQFYVHSPFELCLLRVLIGFGMGGDFAVGHAILAEFSPRKHRGTLLGSFSVIWTIGYVVANVLGMRYADASPDAWRWLLASAGIPAVIVLLARIGTPESPRWLLRKGRAAEAKSVVLKHFGGNVTLDVTHDEHAQTAGGFIRLFEKDLIRRTVFNCAFFVCLVIPYFAIYTFLPTILKAIHLNNGSGADLLLNGFLVLGALIGIWLTIKLPRRVFLIGSFAVTCVSLVALSVLPESATLAMIVAFGIFTLTMSAFSNLVGVFPPECFPTEVRACGVGLAIACSRLGSAVGTFLLPLGIAGFGFHVTMVVLAAVLLVGMIVSIAWAPETRHLTLNEASGG